MIRKTGRKLLLNLRVLLPFAAIAFVVCFLSYDDRARAEIYPINQQVQAEKILVMQKQIEINSGRIYNLELRGSLATQANTEELKLLALRVANLEQSVWLWKGIVFGFGSIISLVEILQALGVIRYKNTERRIGPSET